MAAKKKSAKKPAAKQTAAKKPVSKKKPAASPAARKATRKETPAPRSHQELLEAIVGATRLGRDEILSRALSAFAAAHGLSFAAAHGLSFAPAVPAPAPAPVAAKPVVAAAAAPAPTPVVEDETPSLGPDVRLYVHPPGRAPTEMIKDTFIIGSNQKCDLWINYPKVENRHLRVVREGNKYFAEDMNTGAGTVIHGEPLSRYEIQHGDDVYLAGFVRIRFYLVS